MYISKLQWSFYSLILQNDMDLVISFDKYSWSALDQLLLFDNFFSFKVFLL